MATAPQLLTIPEVTERLRCSERHVYRLIETRAIATTNLGIGAAKTRIREDVLAAFIEAQTTPARTTPGARKRPT